MHADFISIFPHLVFAQSKNLKSFTEKKVNAHWARGKMNWVDNGKGVGLEDDGSQERCPRWS